GLAGARGAGRGARPASRGRAGPAGGRAGPAGGAVSFWASALTPSGRRAGPDSVPPGSSDTRRWLDESAFAYAPAPLGGAGRLVPGPVRRARWRRLGGAAAAAEQRRERPAPELLGGQRQTEAELGRARQDLRRRRRGEAG